MAARASVNVAICISVFLCWVLLLLLTCPCEAKFVQDDRFMSDVNLEHYYVIEENALSNADVLLRDGYFGADDEEEEDEEEHLQHAPNLTSFRSVIDETKAVHRVAGPDLELFLAHPINIFHLFRRLDNGWREGLELLLATKPCRKWNLPTLAGRIRYLRDNLPGREELERVVEYIAKLQKIHKFRTRDIVQGKIGDSVSMRPLDIHEQFAIVQVLRENDETSTVLEWLHQIYELMLKLSPTQKERLSFSQTDILNMMASAYYDIGRIRDALERTEKALEKDPTNNIARSNRVFFTNKLASETMPSVHSAGKKLPKYERLCGKKRQGKISKKKCRLVRVGLMYYKMEPIRRTPSIVLYHDVIRNKSADILKSHAHEIQTDQAWVAEERFKPPTVNVIMDLDKITRKTVKREATSLLGHLSALATLKEGKLETWEKLQVINVGLEGMHLNLHQSELGLYSYNRQILKKETGAYYVFLNDVKIGGEVAFIDKNMVLRPEKGSVLFYHHSKMGLHSFCPVIGSSLWVAIRPLVDVTRNYCIDEDEWL